jgi:transposase
MQIDIRDRNILPASFEMMRKKWPKAKIHIEDGTGMVVWSEK